METSSVPDILTRSSCQKRLSVDQVVVEHLPLRLRRHDAGHDANLGRLVRPAIGLLSMESTAIKDVATERVDATGNGISILATVGLDLGTRMVERVNPRSETKPGSGIG